MEYILLSDVHGNLPALEAVLQDIHEYGHDVGIDLRKVLAGNRALPKDGEAPSRIINLGDAVGYYTFPDEVVDILWEIGHKHVVGNHDQLVMYLQGKDHWGELREAHRNSLSANEMAFWTARNMDPSNLERLETLVYLDDNSERIGPLLFTHSNPYAPGNFQFYIENHRRAEESFFSPFQEALTRTRRAFVGHAHIPQVYGRKKVAEDRYETEGGKLTLLDPKADIAIRHRPDDLSVAIFQQAAKGQPFSHRIDLSAYGLALAVVPSVGQPRDRNPLTGYAVYDDDADVLEVRRLPYDVDRTLAHLAKAEVDPEVKHRLSQRLPRGI